MYKSRKYKSPKADYVTLRVPREEHISPDEYGDDHYGHYDHKYEKKKKYAYRDAEVSEEELEEALEKERKRSRKKRKKRLKGSVLRALFIGVHIRRNREALFLRPVLNPRLLFLRHRP